MACHQCDHTMHPISEGIFWCPRCGSVKYPAIKLEYTPMVVEWVGALVPSDCEGEIPNIQMEISKPVEGT